MFRKKIDSVVKGTEEKALEGMEKTNGFLQKASNFIARHVQKGERLLEIEKLEKEYELNDYMSQYMDAFDDIEAYESARSHVLNELVEEYLAEVPDKSKFTLKAEYIETRVDELFGQEITLYEKKKRLKDLFEVRSENQK